MPSIPPTLGARPPSVTRTQFTRLPDNRPDSTVRGYTHRWKRFAKSFIVQHPLCLHCEQRNRTTLATLVDHIIPVTDSGEADPNFYREGNHQPLCRRCHAVKTAEDTRKGLNR